MLCRIKAQNNGRLTSVDLKMFGKNNRFFDAKETITCEKL